MILTHKSYYSCITLRLQLHKKRLHHHIVNSLALIGLTIARQYISYSPRTHCKYCYITITFMPPISIEQIYDNPRIVAVMTITHTLERNITNDGRAESTGCTDCSLTGTTPTSIIQVHSIDTSNLHKMLVSVQVDTCEFHYDRRSKVGALNYVLKNMCGNYTHVTFRPASPCNCLCIFCDSSKLMRILLREHELWVHRDIGRHISYTYLRDMSTICRLVGTMPGGCGKTSLYICLSRHARGLTMDTLQNAMLVLLSVIVKLNIPTVEGANIDCTHSKNNHRVPGKVTMGHEVSTSFDEGAMVPRFFYKYQELQGTGSHQHVHRVIDGLETNV